jgi:hypothetical protein
LKRLLDKSGRSRSTNGTIASDSDGDEINGVVDDDDDDDDDVSIKFFPESRQITLILSDYLRHTYHRLQACRLEVRKFEGVIYRSLKKSR